MGCTLCAITLAARSGCLTTDPRPPFPLNHPHSFGIRGLVIDPYNELDHQRPPGVSETEYVSQMLTKIKRFAQHYDAHVWFVAHPKQLQQWRGDAPNLYDISGSAHFVNKADNGVVIHRVRGEGAADSTSTTPKQVNDKVREWREICATVLLHVASAHCCTRLRKMTSKRGEGRSRADSHPPIPPPPSLHTPPRCMSSSAKCATSLLAPSVSVGWAGFDIEFLGVQAARET